MTQSASEWKDLHEAIRPAKKEDLAGDRIHLWHGTSKKAADKIFNHGSLKEGPRGLNASADITTASQFPEETGSDVLLLLRAHPNDLDVDPNDQIGETVEDGLFPEGGFGSSATIKKSDILAGFDLTSTGKNADVAIKALGRGDIGAALKLGVKIRRPTPKVDASATNRTGDWRSVAKQYRQGGVIDKPEANRLRARYDTLAQAEKSQFADEFGLTGGSSALPEVRDSLVHRKINDMEFRGQGEAPPLHLEQKNKLFGTPGVGESRDMWDTGMAGDAESQGTNQEALKSIGATAISRQKLQEGGHRNLLKPSDLFKHGYSVSHWVKPGEAGSEVLEFNPRDPSWPRLTATNYAEQKAIHEALGVPVVGQGEHLNTPPKPRIPKVTGTAEKDMFGDADIAGRQWEPGAIKDLLKDAKNRYGTIDKKTLRKVIDLDTIYLGNMNLDQLKEPAKEANVQITQEHNAEKVRKLIRDKIIEAVGS